MSASHFQAVPVVALQLAVQLQRYRSAVRVVPDMPHNHAARREATAAIRDAGVLAFAVPAVWPSWGDMIVRHMAFFGEWLEDAPRENLRRAWRRLEDRAEIVTQHCIDWALRQQSRHPVPPETAALFLAWDETRREAFGLARQIEALDELDPRVGAVAPPDALHQRHESAADAAMRLWLRAAAALQVSPQALDATSDDPLRSFETLYANWRAADEAAAAAELAIFEMEARGLRVEDWQREHAAELRARARMHRQAIFEAGRL